MSKRNKPIETRVIVEPVELETDDLESLAATLLRLLHDVDELAGVAEDGHEPAGGGEAPLSGEEPAA